MKSPSGIRSLVLAIFPDTACWRKYSTQISRIRNIGIIAHIDAGKTTTTERMLFYAGLTRRIGDVDRGDTVTDYLPEERERGITITAAAITFPWKGHKFNLIDTPGHVDFSMEVERSLRVLDGAVTILDGSAGVQAQTKTVWRQASKYNVPRLIFINKLDKVGADFDRTVREVREKLSNLVPVCIQSPIYGSGDGFKGERIIGVEDLIGQESLIWKDPDGVQIERIPWGFSGGDDRRSRREALLERLAELDDEFLEKYLSYSGTNIKVSDIMEALGRLTIANRIAPVLAGSAAKNIGVQPVLDSITSFLPPPDQRPVPLLNLTAPKSKAQYALLALAFKVIHDEQRGPLVFVRVYSGVLSCRMTLRNSTRGGKERATKLFTIFANKFEEIDEAGTGSVVVLLGLKGTRTGDTLTADHEKFQGQLTGIAIPPPVFTCSVEAESSGDSARLEEALRIVEMEDPSVRVTRDLESGQRHLSGMGELHLEIVGKRITRDLKAKAVFGAIQISYKEIIADLKGPLNISETMDREVMGKRMVAALRLSMGASSSFELQSCVINFKDVTMTNDADRANAFKPSPLKSIDGLQEAIQEGLEGALQEGPTASFPLLGLSVTVEEIGWTDGGSSLDAFRYLALAMLRRWLTSQSSRLAEPIMSVEIAIPAAHLGYVLTDIHSARRGQVTNSSAIGGPRNPEEGEFAVSAEIPLASMLGYASALRGNTAGSGSFTMQPLTYRATSREEEARVLQGLGLTRRGQDAASVETGW